jgi:hypothetical protein
MGGRSEDEANLGEEGHAADGIEAGNANLAVPLATGVTLLL